MTPWLVLPLALQVLSALATPVPGNNNGHERCGNSQPTLRSAASGDGKLYFGSAVASYYFANTNFSAITKTQIGQFTPENEMKWEVIHPEPNSYNWTGSDLVIAQARKQGALLRGHNFCWDSQTPEWVTNITNPTELKEVLREHINAVMGRYGRQLYAFDVVNEPLNDDGTWKSNVWYNVLGEDYIGIALDYAHAAAPNVNLYINDYNIESVNNKSQAMLTIAKGLLRRGKPLHGIGFESHFISGSVPTDMAASMKGFTEIGLDVAITELDVRVPITSAGVASNSDLMQQAADYAFVTNVCVGNKNCPGVTVWGFFDGTSWVPSVFAGYGAADLYDLEYIPKPAFNSTLSALKA